MYLSHFGLCEFPFTLTPNTDFFLNLKPHIEAMQVLMTALQQGEGFIKVTGEVGTGKTLICRKLLNELPDNFAVAYVPNPFLTPSELRWAVAIELGLTYEVTVDQQQLTQMLQQHLLALAAQGKSVVVILDEAQALPDESLEALRLFTNLETERRKLLQVVLFGQPELDERLASKQFRQLRQRISFSYQLRSMTVSEVGYYIEHRMRVAGHKGGTVFSSAQTKMIAKASLGVPRLVNVLSHKALLLCFGHGQFQIVDQQVRLAIADTIDAKKPIFWPLYSVVFSVVTLIALALMYWQGVLL
ncbi:MAG: AAA family ATPase [Gammaproteobacteria bacterium]|nr:AAA family ATPase [Gammaproteobacteria bacterium]